VSATTELQQAGAADAPAFDPSTIDCFVFRGHHWDEATHTARLDYALVPRAGGQPIELSEEIVFTPGDATPGHRRVATAPRALGAAERAALERCLRLLHWIAGVSYYKAALPSAIEIEGEPPSPAMAEFLDRLYRLGLAELAYRNGIDLDGRIRFPRGPAAASGLAAPAPDALALPRRTAIPVGGGKDSIVTIEAFKAAGEPAVLLSVGNYEPIRATAEIAGLPRIVIERRIASGLLALNRAGAINGHVPVSAVIAAIVTAAAVVYGFDEAALSNERSASAAHLVWRGTEVNHQYSKSLDFETGFDKRVGAEVLPGFRYYSFLRPLSELAITGTFRHHAAYHPVFRSCNRAFRLDAADRARHWCCNCPKCRFVFLALAPWMSPAALVEIFGENLLDDGALDDGAQEAGFAELLGLADHRPFECVGEEEESAAALGMLARDPRWRDTALVPKLLARLREERGVSDAQIEGWIETALAPSPEHRLPARLLRHLPAVQRPALSG
jgi:hypothetical protein